MLEATSTWWPVVDPGSSQEACWKTFLTLWPEVGRVSGGLLGVVSSQMVRNASWKLSHAISREACCRYF